MELMAKCHKQNDYYKNKQKVKKPLQKACYNMEFFRKQKYSLF